MAGLAEEFSLTVPAEESDDGIVVSSTAQRVILGGVNGRRALWRGIPLTTQLCYSRSDVRQMVTEAVVEYALRHPDEAVIYVCFADGANNFCECVECRKLRPSDWYVMLLNQIDQQLTAKGLPTRIAFSVYVDLLWAPVRERIHRPQRFLLIFSPYTRSYDVELWQELQKKIGDIAPFELNKLNFPTAPAENLTMLKEWREFFTGESLLFDYHLWQAYYGDPGQLGLAQTLHGDVAKLNKMGMAGFVSCQCQRISFPTNIYLEVLGRTLWTNSTTFESVAVKHFSQLYGDSGGEVMAYLQSVSTSLGRALLTMPHTPADKVGRARLAQLSSGWVEACSTPERLIKAVETGCREADPTAAAAWQILRHYFWFIGSFAEFHTFAWQGDARATQICDEIAVWLERRLPQLHACLDTWMYKRLMQHTLWVNELDFTERTELPVRNTSNRKDTEAF